jgi:nucleoid-associated protein YgaU
VEVIMAARSVRLTRRGRAVVVVTLTGGLLAGAGSLASASFAGPDSASTPAPQLRHVIVQPGDTLWGIATKAAPGADPRATIRRITDLNGLTDESVRAGQQLVLPAG